MLEFTEGPCKDFFLAKGVIHQKSCVGRPQQNGMVERKHRHILKIARALRFQANLPIQFWGDCVMTATHLINRLPTPVLRHKTPYELLLYGLPDYQHLRVFGCFVVAVNPFSVKDKMKPRGVPCLFLGYPQATKGDVLLNLLDHKRFISRGVIFFEHIFPYRFSSSSQCLHPLPFIGVSSPQWADDLLLDPLVQPPLLLLKATVLQSFLHQIHLHCLLCLPVLILLFSKILLPHLRLHLLL